MCAFLNNETNSKNSRNRRLFVLFQMEQTTKVSEIADNVSFSRQWNNHWGCLTDRRTDGKSPGISAHAHFSPQVLEFGGQMPVLRCE
jgi:hypothetical protein